MPAPSFPLGLEPGLEARHYFPAPVPTFSNGVHVVVVEVDPETGQVHLLDYAAVNDAGRLINPRIVDGQIAGGIAQGLGGALLEELAYDEAGELLSGSLLDYAMPTASQIPPLKLDHLETPSPLNPLGIRIDRTPLTAPRIRQLIERALAAPDAGA